MDETRRDAPRSDGRRAEEPCSERREAERAAGGDRAPDAGREGGARDGGLDRRDFLRCVGAGAIAASAASAAPVVPAGPAMAGPFRSPAEGAQHFVPADKKLTTEWLAELRARGEPRVCRGDELETIGMPVGGIGAGQLYLRGDGTLGSWQIFNRRNFSGYGAESYRRRPIRSPVDQGFAVVVEEGEDREVRSLDRRGFPDVEFTGSYPIGEVRYAREGFPVEVRLEAFSPFVPLDAEESGLPATILHYTARNATDRDLHVSLVGWLENAVCRHSSPRVRGVRSTYVGSERGRALLLHRVKEAVVATEPEPRPAILLADFEAKGYGRWEVEGEAFGTQPASGTLPRQQAVSGFRGRGLVNSFLGGDAPRGRLTSPPLRIERRYINLLVGGGDHDGKTCVRLRVGDEVVRIAHGRRRERLEPVTWDVGELEGQLAVLEIIDEHSGGWGHINVDHIELSDERADEMGGPLDRLEDWGSMALATADPARGFDGSPDGLGEEDVPWRAVAPEPPYGGVTGWSIRERGKSALATDRVRLRPGERRTFTFVLAWHFPNRREGNHYARRFPNAKAVVHHVFDHHARLAGDTRRWRDTWYDSTLPRWLLDRLHSTVANLATGTCMRWGNGRFWAWEGVGCCSGTCTHVWNYAHALGRLFPKLERTVREMQDLGEALHPDGLIGFRGVRNGHYAADGQCGTILKCYREHRMSADDSFLRRNWPNIRKALLYSIAQDGNDDGLIENSQHNTYDINFMGPNTFVGALYLAALRAGEEMAREVGEHEFAARLRGIFESGRRLSEERLWNGEYYVQRVDLEEHPRHQYGDGCLSDQLFGQGWAHQVGLGHLYSPDRVRQALQSVWRYNWAPDVAPQNAVHKPERWFVAPGEAGLFTCTWPRSRHLAGGVRYRNEVWTGIEYQVAGHMIAEGMVEEGLAICRAIHDRYAPGRHNPYNEVECGDHYARALASWGVFVSLCGFDHHGPQGFLAFAPRITPHDFRAAFTAAEGWGTFRQRRSTGTQRDEILVRQGRLRVRRLAFEVEGGGVPRVEVRAGDGTVPTSVTRRGDRVEIDLAREVVVPEGSSLTVLLSGLGAVTQSD